MGSSLSCIQAIIYDHNFLIFPRPAEEEPEHTARKEQQACSDLQNRMKSPSAMSKKVISQYV